MSLGCCVSARSCVWANWIAYCDLMRVLMCWHMEMTWEKPLSAVIEMDDVEI